MWFFRGGEQRWTDEKGWQRSSRNAHIKDARRASSGSFNLLRHHRIPALPLSGYRRKHVPSAHLRWSILPHCLNFSNILLLRCHLDDAYASCRTPLRSGMLPFRRC